MLLCQCVNTSELGVIERCGKFNRFAGAGVNFICCPFEIMADRISLRVQHLEVTCETKTLDNVFVNVAISIQYQVILAKAYQSYYTLHDPTRQIRSYVFDVIRAAIPTLELDNAFEAKDEVAQAVKTNLSRVMEDYGFIIIKALVTDITPRQRVRDAMNEINASKRLREAAIEKAEGNKIRVVKAAEADAESKYLSGVGVARQRKAIIDGLRDSVNQFSHDVHGTTAKDVMDLLLLTQYLDMMKEIGENSHSNAVFIPTESSHKSARTGDMILPAKMQKI
jgi:regulator of protease activity HflC (stomatin/prohibitin superfamily)